MLECYHFFCSHCIKTWLLKKIILVLYIDFKLKLIKKGEIDSKNWNIINFDKNEYYKDISIKKY